MKTLLQMGGRAFGVRLFAVAAIGLAVLTASASGAQFDKPAILGNPDFILRDSQKQLFAPQSDTFKQQTLVPAIKVPSTQIGFRNPTSSDVAAIVYMGNGQSRTVLLKAHQFETMDCSSCGAAIKAVVPRSNKPAPDDFSLNLVRGNVYEFRYDNMTKRWVLVGL